MESSNLLLLLVMLVATLNVSHSSEILMKCSQEDAVDICDGDNSITDYYMLHLGIKNIIVRAEDSCSKRLHYFHTPPGNIEPESCDWRCYPLSQDKGICVGKDETTLVTSMSIDPTAAYPFSVASMIVSTTMYPYSTTSVSSTTFISMTTSGIVSSSVFPWPTQIVTTTNLPQAKEELISVYMIWAIIATCTVVLLVIGYIMYKRRTCMQRPMYTQIPSTPSSIVLTPSPTPPQRRRTPPRLPILPSPATPPNLPVLNLEDEDDDEPIAKRTRSAKKRMKMELETTL